MDRNREGRRSIMANSANGLSRRRHRTSSLRESADEDGPMELTEPTRFRDRGVKKDRDRDRSSRSKKRRGDRSMHESNRDDSSDESSSGNDQDDDEDGGGGGSAPMLPVHQSVFHHQVRDRESFYEASRPATTWRPANELIGFSVPRKARSASTKRSHENWVSGNGVGGEQSNRHSSASPSPVRPAVPSPVSPTSSTASLRKKMVNKPNGTKQRPPKSSAKASSPKPEEELEIEIAEVLYGLRAQSQGSSKKDSVANIDMREVDGSKSAGKSGVPSSLSDSASTAPENRVPSSGPLSIIAPKRKRPRQVIEDLGSPIVAQSSISSIPDVKKNIEPGLEKQLGSAADNEGIPHDFMGSRVAQPEPAILDVARRVNKAFKPVSEDSRDITDVGQGMGEAFPKQEQIVAVVTPNGDCDAATTTLANSMKSETGSQREDGFEIDLMAPPPPSKSSPEREDYNGEDRGEDEAENVHRDKKKAKVMTDAVEQDKAVLSEDIETSLQLDLGKHERDTGPRGGGEDGEKLQQAKSVKDEHSVAGTTVQCSSLPLPVSLAGWPKGFPPIGYVAPMQGAAPVSGNAVPPSLVQPLISQPRSKRCATHCHIARSIHCQQQIMKMNPFWPGAAAPIFGAKSCNVNILQSGELQRSLNSVQDKNQALTVIPGDNGREKGGQAPNLADTIGKQQILFQHALPAGASPNGVVPVPTFVFPVNQQSVAAAGASVQSGSVNTSNPIPVSGSATASPSVSFNYPNMPSNNTHQYLAILQNNPYPYPIPASGAPSAFGGVAHAQHIPYFNGSFYPSQLIHPLQIQQQQPSTKLLQHQQVNQNTSISSGSSTPQKQQQKQQQQQSRSHLIPASHQVRRLDIEAGGEDSPSTADSYVSRSPMFAQNFAANYSLVAPSPPNGASHGGEKNPQQQPQQGMKQPFTVSFAGMNGADISSVSEAAKNGYHHQIMVAAASAQAAQQKRNSRLSEEGKSEGNDSSSNVNENKKSSMGKASASAAQSIAFSHSAMTGPGTVNGSNSQFQAQLQFQQQQMLQFQQQLHQHQQQQQQHQQQYQQQLQQQQQHLVAARHKSLATSNGSAHDDHLASSSPGIAKFPCVQSATPQNFGRSSSPTQSSRWKSSATTMTSEAASSLASATMKTHSQSQQVRAHQNPTQISFVANQKSSPTPQGHQAPSNHPSQTSPIVVGSPSNSLSKDGGGSPKATSFSSCGNRAGQPSTITSQRSRNSSPVGSSRNTPILGNPHIFPSNAGTRPQMQQQSQLQKHQVQQAQLMFSNAAYLQAQQASQPNAMNSAAAAASSYYMQRWRPEQHQQFVHPQGSTMSTSDVKAVISSAASNVKAGGLTSQGTGTSPLLAPPGFSFHAVPAAAQIIQKEHKPAA